LKQGMFWNLRSSFTKKCTIY